MRVDEIAQRVVYVHERKTPAHLLAGFDALHFIGDGPFSASVIEWPRGSVAGVGCALGLLWRPIQAFGSYEELTRCKMWD